jgi:hypothetical protein
MESERTVDADFLLTVPSGLFSDSVGIEASAPQWKSAGRHRPKGDGSNIEHPTPIRNREQASNVQHRRGDGSAVGTHLRQGFRGRGRPRHYQGSTATRGMAARSRLVGLGLSLEISEVGGNPDPGIGGNRAGCPDGDGQAYNPRYTRDACSTG